MRHPGLHEVDHQSTAGRWRHVYGAPDARLRPYILRYQEYHEEEFRRRFRRELPTPTTTLVITFHGAVRLLAPNGRDEKRVLTGSYLVGPLEKAALIRLDAGWHGMIVDLNPLGARRIFGIPMMSLSNRVVPLDTLTARGKLWQVAERVADAPQPEDRFGVLDEVFRERLWRLDGDEAAGRSWERLVRSGGHLRIGSLADDLQLSHRRLVELCRDSFGLPPKRLARLVRCDRALHMMLAPRRPTWTQIAAGCGFYDQAHLINEIRDFTGVRPTEFRRSSSRQELSSRPSWDILRRRLPSR